MRYETYDEYQDAIERSNEPEPDYDTEEEIRSDEHRLIMKVEGQMSCGKTRKMEEINNGNNNTIYAEKK